jgi:hypothetical protein
MLKFDLSPTYKGTGVSQDLDRGLLVYNDGVPLLEEGMGLGACAYQIGGHTYFTSFIRIKKEEDLFETTSSIDLRLELKVFGIRTRLFTKAQEFIATNIYMKHKIIQKPILVLSTLSRWLFNVKTCFVKVPSLGNVRLKYSVRENEVLIEVSSETINAGGKMFVMNELGGKLFDKGIKNGKITDPPSGWEHVDEPYELYSGTHSLAFTVEQLTVPEHVSSRLFWGRETILNTCCWAGFESEIICDYNKFTNYTYLVKFREVHA